MFQMKAEFHLKVVPKEAPQLTSHQLKIRLGSRGMLIKRIKLGLQINKQNIFQNSQNVRNISINQILRIQKMQDKFEDQKDSLLQPKLLTVQEQKQKLKCPHQIAAFSVCIDPKCLVAGLMCRNTNCQCTNTHYKCHHIQIDRVLDSIDKHQKQLPQKVRESYKTTHKIINEMFDELSKIRDKLYAEESYFGLTEKQLSFMALIDEQKIDKICGKIVSELQQTFETEISFTILSHEEILRDFQMIKPEFDSLFKHIEHNYTKFDPKEMSKIIFNDSKIVNQSKDKQVMKNWLQETWNNKEVSLCSRLLYRGSQHNFSATEFHKKCDGVENTLVMVKTEFDKVIGGFTPSKWKSSQGESVNDVTGKAFLFSLTLKEKYKCVNPKCSINCNKDYGPKFGGGSDLHLSDNAHNNNDSYAYFPDSYNLIVNGNNKYVNNQESYTLFSGATNGNNFKLKQYQVYEIIGI